MSLLWLLVLTPLLFKGNLFFPTEYYELSKATALMGLMAFSISLLCGCRSRWLNKYFNSLNRAYFCHHLFGIASGILFLIHLITYGLTFFTDNLFETIKVSLDIQNPIILSGWVSLVTLFIGLCTTKLKYKSFSTWKKFHSILIISLFIILIHLKLVYLEWNLSEILTMIILFFSVLVLFLHFYYPRVLRSTFSYQVSEVKNLNSNTVEVDLNPLQQPISFEAGQFIYLSIKCSFKCGVSHEFHPFTIASSAEDKNKLTIIIKSLGDDTEKLLHLRPNNHAIVEGPYGCLLSQLKPSTPQLWIAGGIGITPFLSYLRTWSRDKQNSVNAILILLIKNKNEDIFTEELRNYQSLTTVTHIENQDGQMNSSQLSRLIPSDWKEREIIISGPPGMNQFCRSFFKKAGARKVRTEEFKF